MSAVCHSGDGYMENLIAVFILIVIVGGAGTYLIKAKRSGVKCIGCPAGGACSDNNKIKKKKLEGPVIAKKTIVISGMHCAHCVKIVTDSLNRIDGVAARGNLSKGCVEILLDREVEECVMISAVEKEGFSVDSIRS